ncbi:hypothetical protein [Anderseniella sp. Alg231-50]|uniref:hypothetical protein n=1 Tax=Anderseniella sp. Alg231-50 TaxID=1922226 RepID=UPI00307B4D33
MTKYKIIEASCPEEMETRIRAFGKKGWKPQGGISHSIGPDYKRNYTLLMSRKSKRG